MKTYDVDSKYIENKMQSIDLDTSLMINISTTDIYVQEVFTIGAANCIWFGTTSIAVIVRHFAACLIISTVEGFILTSDLMVCKPVHTTY